MSKRQALHRALLTATKTMVQGGLSETSRRCGKPSCACAHEATARHGPHLYLTYREDGTSQSLYVPAAHAAEARAAREAWATFWTLGCALAAVNRERLRRAWQRAPQPRRKPARSPRRRSRP